MERDLILFPLNLQKKNSEGFRIFNITNESFRRPESGLLICVRGRNENYSRHNMFEHQFVNHWN